VASVFTPSLGTVHECNTSAAVTIIRIGEFIGSRVETESDGTRRSTGGEVKGKKANGVGSQHSCTVSEHGLSSITTADARTSAASSRLN